MGAAELPWARRGTGQSPWAGQSCLACRACLLSPSRQPLLGPCTGVGLPPRAGCGLCPTCRSGLVHTHTRTPTARPPAPPAARRCAPAACWCWSCRTPPTCGAATAWRTSSLWRPGMRRQARGPACGPTAVDARPAPAAACSSWLPPQLSVAHSLLFHPPAVQSEDGSKTVLVEWGREGDQFNLQEQVGAGRRQARLVTELGGALSRATHAAPASSGRPHPWVLSPLLCNPVPAGAAPHGGAVAVRGRRPGQQRGGDGGAAPVHAAGGGPAGPGNRLRGEPRCHWSCLAHFRDGVVRRH